ncbi:MAG: alpha/beta hydrolase family esterase [Gemmataceae bacterium]
MPGKRSLPASNWPEVSRHWLSLALVALSCLPTRAQETVRREWQVDGITRTGLVFIPPESKIKPTPVVFVFHGHGGSSRNAMTSFGMDKAWPQAISVHLQGLNTPGRLTDPEGKKTGWQSGSGDQKDRDLRFFDVVMESLKRDFKVDTQRVYATGHSNGGGFTYLLWAERGEVLAAVGPSAAIGPRQGKDLKPKPLFHLLGDNDPLVKPAWQEAMIVQARKVNGAGEGKPWGKENQATLYPAPGGNDLVVWRHQGGHKFPGKEAVAAMVQFFQEHPAK